MKHFVSQCFVWKVQNKVRLIDYVHEVLIFWYVQHVCGWWYLHIQKDSSENELRSWMVVCLFLWSGVYTRSFILKIHQIHCVGLLVSSFSVSWHPQISARMNRSTYLCTVGTHRLWGIVSQLSAHICKLLLPPSLIDSRGRPLCLIPLTVWAFSLFPALPLAAG